MLLILELVFYIQQVQLTDNLQKNNLLPQESTVEWYDLVVDLKM
jgi:hypothetical protein